MRISLSSTYSLRVNVSALWVLVWAVLLSASVAWLLMDVMENAATVLALVKSFDSQAMVALNFDGGAVADRFFYHTSQLDTWLPLSLVTAAYTIGWHRGTWRERLALVLVIALAMTFTDPLTSSVIKPLVARPRPSHEALLAPLLHFVGDYRGGHYGFVSGHAANICCLTLLLAYMFRCRPMKVVLTVFALLLCYSRIYLGVHYPGDILGGALIGLAVAWAVVRLTPAGILPRYSRVPWGVVVVWAVTTAMLLI